RERRGGVRQGRDAGGRRLRPALAPGERAGGDEERQCSTETRHAGKLANVSGGVHRATLSSLRPLARDVVEGVLALAGDDAQLSWRTGQFISLTCGTSEGGEPI